LDSHRPFICSAAEESVKASDPGRQKQIKSHLPVHSPPLSYRQDAVLDRLSTAFGFEETTAYCIRTDKKETEIFLIYQEIQMDQLQSLYEEGLPNI
jgi:hypothetical protein